MLPVTRLHLRRAGRWTAALAAVVVAAPSARGVANAATSGCRPGIRAVSYTSGGRPAPMPAAAEGATACAWETGFATSEVSLAVTNSGALVFSPAETENSVAVSTDGARSWHLAYPQDEQYTALWNTDDPYVTVDRRTGRVFWVHATGPLRTAPLLVAQSPIPFGLTTVLAAASGFQVYSTVDDGRTWTTADEQLAPTADWEKVFVGPPPARLHQTGYPDVSYVCANSPFEVIGPGRLCYKSLDGGVTFRPAGYVFPSIGAPFDCPALATNAGVVAPDGTTYQPVSCSGGSWVAASDDEGTTYRWIQVPGVPGSGAGLSGPAFQLAVDAGGTLYAMWSTNAGLFLSVSTDRARSWRPPLSIAAPGSRGIDLPQLAAGPRSAVGVVYYAGATHLTAYITETTNATATHPIFVSAPLNDPGHPIFVDRGLIGGTPRADFVGAAYDRAGILWAGVVKQLGPPDANNHIPTTGYVGRIAVGTR